MTENEHLFFRFSVMAALTWLIVVLSSSLGSMEWSTVV